MNTKKSVTQCAALLGLLFAGVTQAHAAFIPKLVGGAPTFHAGVYTYTYDVLLTENSKVDVSKSPSFFTLYDFQGYISGSAKVNSSVAGTSSWTITEQPYGVNGFGTVPNDFNPTNITFTYSNPAVYTGSLDPFFVVTLNSTYGIIAGMPGTEYTGQTVGLDNTNQGNIGLVLGPNAPPGGFGGNGNTPEPGTVAMLISSTLGGFVALRKRRR